MPVIEVSVDLNEFTDDEIIREVRLRGFHCSEQDLEDFDREEFLFLIEMIDKMPFNWYTNRIRDKLLKVAHG